MSDTDLFRERLMALIPALNRQSDLQEILRLVSGEMMTLLKPDIASVLLINPSTQETMRTVFRDGIDEEGGPLLGLAKTAISGWVFKYDRTFFTGNLPADRRLAATDWSALNLRCVICAPMRLATGFVGALFAFSRRKTALSEDDAALLEQLADLVSPYFRNVQNLDTVFQTRLSEASLLKKYEAAGLLGKSPPFVELLYGLEAASRSPVRVLLEGESGTGKELVARAVHRFSERQDGPFVALDCGALPGNLIESELFGHVRGAFTGAAGNKKGLIETADGGTLFLDEITNLPFDVQAKLLRVLQESEIRPVGATASRQVDVRIIAATSSSLQGQVERGTFREDLYYRLYVYPLHIPNLADRTADIPLLAHHFLRRFAGEQGKQVHRISRGLVRFLRERHWRGNIRELENLMERLVTLVPAGSMVLDLCHLPQELAREAGVVVKAGREAEAETSLHDRLAEAERDMLLDALEECDWNQSAAARSLGLSEQAMRYRMKRLNIARPE
ncbi:sigma 54-interacting transcriptional regulator [bacterium]|nr:sigma 54-interacting transcriptional regulator [bacterium]